MHGAPARALAVSSDGGVRAVEGTGTRIEVIDRGVGRVALRSASGFRYLRFDREAGRLAADSPGPHPNERDGVRWTWRTPKP